MRRLQGSCEALQAVQATPQLRSHCQRRAQRGVHNCFKLHALLAARILRPQGRSSLALYPPCFVCPLARLAGQLCMRLSVLCVHLHTAFSLGRHGSWMG